MAEEGSGAGRGRRRLLFLVLAAAVAGGIAWAAGAPDLARLLWQAATLTGLLPLGLAVGRDLLAGRTGVDLIALAAMVFSLFAGEALAGAVVALMLAGGQALEDFAGGRARRELAALLSRAPREAHRLEDGRAVTVPLAAVQPGDLLLVRPGEVLPVDGRIAGAAVAVLDESALTGEAAPVVRSPGDPARSGTVNAGGLFELRALAAAEASTYAGIVRLVAQAAREKAPMVRLADRFAIVFLPLTLAMAAAAWLASGDPRRALAVLVVATPCPLILAAPIAFIAGLSRAARSGVVIKSGAALEALSRASVLLLDKTGTITTGRPELAEVVPLGELDPDAALRYAASADLASLHPLAAAIVAAARQRGLELAVPEAAREEPGEGIAAEVGGRQVRVGALAWVSGAEPDPAALAIGRRAETGSSVPFVAIGGRLAAALILEDRLRADAAETLNALRAAGFRSIRMLTGDRAEVAREVAAAVGISEIAAGCTPAGKVAAVREARQDGITVMVGDGINDAPALAAAEVGVAMGARGASAASEAADVVILPDRLDLLPLAQRIARRSRRIALESIVAGMALSAVGMAAAAAGWLPPVAGALAQEVIDLAVILNALRALRG